MSSPPGSGTVPSALALALLESLRALDTPAGEALGDEDLPAALPQRLGLSSAVERQILRYRRRAGKRDVPAREAASLFALIGRRPDAERVFAEAGRRLAHHELRERRLPARLSTSALPERLRRRLALRRIRRLVRRVSPASEVRIEPEPPTLLVRRCLPASAAGGHDGCAIVRGAMEVILATYRAAAVRVAHVQCEGRSDPRCAWRLELQTEPGSESGGEGPGRSGDPVERSGDWPAGSGDPAGGPVDSPAGSGDPAGRAEVPAAGREGPPGA